MAFTAPPRSGRVQMGQGKNAFVFEVTGIKELDDRLHKMDQKMRRNIGTKALRVATHLVRDRARQLVPVDSKALRKGIATQTRSLTRFERLQGHFAMKVAQSRKKKMKLRYITFVELGVPAYNREGIHFLKRAAMMEKDAVTDVFIGHLRHLINEADNPSGSHTYSSSRPKSN